MKYLFSIITSFILLLLFSLMISASLSLSTTNDDSRIFDKEAYLNTPLSPAIKSIRPSVFYSMIEHLPNFKNQSLLAGKTEYITALASSLKFMHDFDENDIYVEDMLCSPCYIKNYIDTNRISGDTLSVSVNKVLFHIMNEGCLPVSIVPISYNCENITIPNGYDKHKKNFKVNLYRLTKDFGKMTDKELEEQLEDWLYNKKSVISISLSLPEWGNYIIDDLLIDTEEAEKILEYYVGDDLDDVWQLKEAVLNNYSPNNYIGKALYVAGYDADNRRIAVVDGFIRNNQEYFEITYEAVKMLFFENYILTGTGQTNTSQVVIDIKVKDRGDFKYTEVSKNYDTKRDLFFINHQFKNRSRLMLILHSNYEPMYFYIFNITKNEVNLIYPLNDDFNHLIPEMPVILEDRYKGFLINGNSGKEYIAILFSKTKYDKNSIVKENITNLNDLSDKGDFIKNIFAKEIINDYYYNEENLIHILEYNIIR